MNSETISNLADWLATNKKKIEDKSQKLDAQKVYDIWMLWKYSESLSRNILI